MQPIDLTLLIDRLTAPTYPLDAGPPQHEIIMGTLRSCGFDVHGLRSSFPDLFIYSFVKYGLGRPKEVLKFVGQVAIQEAFRSVYAHNDPGPLYEFAETVVFSNRIAPEKQNDESRDVMGSALAEFFRTFLEMLDEITFTPDTASAIAIDEVSRVENETAVCSDRPLRRKYLSDVWEKLRRLTAKQAAYHFAAVPAGDRLKVFISSTMNEFRDIRSVLNHALESEGIRSWIYETDSGARPEGVMETSLGELEAADVYVGIFGKEYGEGTIEEYRRARHLKKPCFIYIRDKDAKRAVLLEKFLHAEVYNLKRSVTYQYFVDAIELSNQVAKDIMCWVVRRYREATSELERQHHSDHEKAHLKEIVTRLQNASNCTLPHGTGVDYLAKNTRAWFRTLGYQFEPYEVRTDDYFEWIINIPGRRGTDRVLVCGIKGEAQVTNIKALYTRTREVHAREGWLIVTLLKSEAACRELQKEEYGDVLFCYTFDELIDHDADFTGYFAWLEEEVKRRRVDQLYVPLGCVKPEFDPHTNERIGESLYTGANGWIEEYVDKWLVDPSMNHISVLGEFGTGKTWFALHYAWRALQRYLAEKNRGVQRPRLPLFIPLRDYAKAVTVESLFSEFFFRKHEIPLPGYSAFEQLNRMGKLLLIFDGFDEMAARVDRQKMINNFWELARVVVPGAKAILTSRTEYFHDAREGRALLGAELQASTAGLSGEAPQFEILELSKFDNDQIRQAFFLAANSSRTPVHWRVDGVEDVMKNLTLLDLARRPLMIDLILDALPAVQRGNPIDLARVYLYAVLRKLEKDIKEERTFTSLADKIYFLCELSWEMICADKMTINYKDFPDRIRRLFPANVREKKDLDHWHYDLMTQTMLIRNADGDYTPAHRSLLEFFVSFKLTAELGILADDFVRPTRAQSHATSTLGSSDARWSEYFRREFDAHGEAVGIPVLRMFLCETPDRLRQTFGYRRLSKELVEWLLPMLDGDRRGTVARFIELITSSTSSSSFDLDFTGGNAATLLSRVDGFAFKGRDLRETHLKGADLVEASLMDAVLDGSVLDDSTLYSCDLRGVSLRDASLTGATFTGVSFEGADLTHANVKGSRFSDCDLTGCALQHATMLDAEVRCGLLTRADLRNADLSGLVVSELSGIRSVAFSPDNAVIMGADSDGKVHAYSTNGGEALWTLGVHDEGLYRAAFNSDGSCVGALTSSHARFWGLCDKQMILTLDGDNTPFTALSFNPRRPLEVSIGGSKGVMVIDLTTQAVRQLSATTKPVTALQYLQDGLHLAVGHVDSLMICDLEGQVASQRIVTDMGRCLGLSLSQERNRLTVYWDITAGSLSATKLSRFDVFSVDGDALTLQYSHEDGADLSHYYPTNRMTALLETDIIAIADAEPYSQVVKLPEGTRICRLMGHRGNVTCLAFNSDGSVLATGSSDGSIVLWDSRLFIADTKVNGASVIKGAFVRREVSHWPEWWQESQISVPDGMVPNPEFGRSVISVKPRINCVGLKLKGAAGLQAKGFKVKGIEGPFVATLGDWLNARGAEET